jgi:hypothetical protein
MRNMLQNIVFSAVVLALAGPAAAQHRHGASGQKSAYPHADAEIEVTIRPEATYRSTHAPSRSRQLNGEVHGVFGLHLTSEFSVNTLAKWERVKLSDADTSVFGGNGAFVEELNAAWERDGRGIRLGKQNLWSFGRAWAEHPGIFAKDFAEDYKLAEALGASAFARIVDDVDFGKHKATAAWFMLDNTALSNSALSRPSAGALLTERAARTRRVDGGAGNTAAPASWMLTLEGDTFDALPGLSYGAGYMFLKRGTSVETGRGNDERRAFASLAWEVEVAKGFTLRPMLEWVNARGADLDGEVAGEPVYGTQSWRTAQLLARWNGWSAVAGATLRDASQPAEAGELKRDSLRHASLEYLFEFGLTVGIGWKQERQPIAIDPDGARGRSSTLGAIAWYAIEF